MQPIQEEGFEEDLTDAESTMLCTALDKEERAVLQLIANTLNRGLNVKTPTATIVKNLERNMERLKETITLRAKVYRDTL